MRAPRATLVNFLKMIPSRSDTILKHFESHPEGFELARRHNLGAVALSTTNGAARRVDVAPAELTPSRLTRLVLEGLVNVSLSPPRTEDKFQREPVNKLFKVDLDASDFDRVCGCGQHAACSECMTMVYRAALAIETSLGIYLRGSRRTWVLSGGRGMHCWAETAWALDSRDCESLVSLLQAQVFEFGAELASVVVDAEVSRGALGKKNV